MIKIDFDNFLERIDKLRECLNNIPKPLMARISSGGKGIHIVSFQDDDKDYREKYDDPERLKLDKTRQEFGLSNNILADVKNGKAAGRWAIVDNDNEKENFINEILKL